MSAPRKYPIAQVARDLGVHPEALRNWVRRAEADAGTRNDLLTTSEREELKRLRGGNRERRRANEILKAASVLFAKELDPNSTEVSAFIDVLRERFGVEPICRTLHVSASAYYQRVKGSASRAPSRTSGWSAWSGRCTATPRGYGYPRVWKALLRAGERVPRCQCSG